ncbi:hypothetical protein ABB37_05460 [Leptomonas pyrrhocoris]|uniref:Uncharacterized protein n=1 Tax=Leptomonas pyrrhocoris TaxID=157538 RepID=A0A0M9G0E0_LEPPY|nr:hypothetical protein ABB37_05460 [Leptomonas pyrrhocoris]XP_015658123.1 hypothetical protein ABB37_05460 [Leptomonas pyrrhocoris]XP_015658124.1 hypothetical protein ABB37_05460 [Leptomonas pyrrhocoris]KPA79683.1 hypothetical protein ABB37_05460 [Leptomonas pyrrhocoris]KPA79684.1 hypothetical protein ABB37_05460 [Leptomonas pyrrhocoris]KPA79685.1 hypothetical protein ABB37_05460 [Leptomonas pyrrhocoris]|eukprot:XP_015658122.1 hypothetical protein ABB37_05460 [Leptomonas pyrrhocoris]
MLSPRLVSAVECDLAVARQLAYFSAGYSPGGQEAAAEAEQIVVGGSGGGGGAVPHAVDPTAHGPPAHAASPIRVAVSNPVQRPRQGTCAVLVELTRPLTWMSHRGPHRGSGGGAGTGAAASVIAGRAVSSTNASAGSEVSAAGGAAVSLSHTSAASGFAAAATPNTASASAPSASPLTAAATAAPPALPLLVATATLEVVFPARYPHEPCQWYLSEEVSFGGVGDHATSSWAVTASHRSGSSRSAANVSSSPLSSSKAGVWSAGSSSSLGGEEGLPRRLVSSRLLNATACDGAMRANSDDDPLGRGAGGVSSKLTAFVVSALGHRLLRWIAESRGGGGSSGGAGMASSPASPTSTPGAITRFAPSALRTHARHSGVSPFLLDFACLLRCWRAVELDVHHLLLPSRIAMAYGGCGARLLRAMMGTHLSGGGANNTTAAVAASAGGSGVTAAAAAVAGVSLSANVLVSPNKVHAAGISNTVGSGWNSIAPAPARGRAAEKSNSASSVAGSFHGPGVASSTLANVNSNSNNNGKGGVSAAPLAAAGSSFSTAVPVSLGVTGAAGVPTTSTSTGASALYPYRRRVVRHFLAVLLPQGDVAVCGRVPSAGGGGGAGGAAPARRGVTSTSTTATKAGVATVPLDSVPLCLLPLYEPVKNSRDGEAATGTQRQPSELPRRAAIPGTLLGCTSQLMRGHVLPSFLLPSHVLGSPYKCEWDDVRLFTGKSADAALHANAKLAKALHLPHVSDLLQVLRRLAKSVATSATDAFYLEEVLWPALMETVGVLRSARLPFWAGMAVCSLLLPSVLEQEEGTTQQQRRQRRGGTRGVMPPLPPPAPSMEGRKEKGSRARSLRRWQQRFAELIAVVTYTERVLAVAQEYTLLCETRLMRCALQRGQQLLHDSCRSMEERRQGSSSQTTAAATVSSACAFPALPVEACRRLHAPLSVCAVCGLSLLRNTVKQNAAATATVSGGGGEGRGLARTPATVSPTGKEAEGLTAKTTHAAVHAALQERRAEGCLVVQCARCGHGGHVEHMSSWWNDPTVHCCPKGCDCICEY